MSNYFWAANNFSMKILIWINNYLDSCESSSSILIEVEFSD